MARISRTPPFSVSRPSPPRDQGVCAGALGAEVEQPAVDEVAALRVEEAAAVAEVGVVGAELVAVVAQRQRLGQAAGQRLEAAEVGDPVGVVEAVEAEPRRPAVVAEAQAGLGKGGGADRIVELGSERRVDLLGSEAIGHRRGI